MTLSILQNEIVSSKGNMIVSASAGTGKTYTMVSKIAYELEQNHTHKVIAAITFTIKAAKEIKNRLKIDTTDHFIGTNNSFVIEEIIKPFIRDVYGLEYNFDVTTDYSKKIKTFKSGMQILKENHVICSYENNNQNFVFELAFEIVKQSRACRLFLQSKYFKIYIDEYQDCDKTMHNFFMYMCNNLGIELFIIGDPKQSIYMWRGAYPEAFNGILNDPNFQHKTLTDNFRSCKQIQNYSNILSDETIKLYQNIVDKNAIIYIKSLPHEWPILIKPYLDINKNYAVLSRTNNDAECNANQMIKSNLDCTYISRTPISDISTSTAWLYNALAQYFILEKYSVYDFMDEIPEQSIGDKKIKTFIENKLNLLDQLIKSNNQSQIIIQVKELGDYLNYECEDEHIIKLINTILNKKYHSAFKLDEIRSVSMTLHSSKGLEYDQVIIFASDYNLENKEDINNHYVAVTRAKSKLIIINFIGDKKMHLKGVQYCKYIIDRLCPLGLKPNDIMEII